MVLVKYLSTFLVLFTFIFVYHPVQSQTLTYETKASSRDEWAIQSLMDDNNNRYFLNRYRQSTFIYVLTKLNKCNQIEFSSEFKTPENLTFYSGFTNKNLIFLNNNTLIFAASVKNGTLIFSFDIKGNLLNKVKINSILTGSICKFSNSQFLLTGSDNGKDNSIILKINIALNVVSAKKIDGTLIPHFPSIIAVKDGNIYLAGYNSSNPKESFLHKFDKELLNSKVYTFKLDFTESSTFADFLLTDSSLCFNLTSSIIIVPYSLKNFYRLKPAELKYKNLVFLNIAQYGKLFISFTNNINSSGIIRIENDSIGLLRNSQSIGDFYPRDLSANRGRLMSTLSLYNSGKSKIQYQEFDSLFNNCFAKDDIFKFNSSLLHIKDSSNNVLSSINITSQPGIIDFVNYKMNFKTICSTFEPFSGIGSNIGIDTIKLCQNIPYTITTMNPNQTSKFYWSTGDTTKTITVNKTGFYKLRTAKGVCESLDSVYVIYATIAKPKVFSDTILCIGNTVTIDATKNQPVYTIYRWHDNQTNGKRVINKKGDYKLVISNNYGCKDSLRFSVAYRDSLKTIIMADTLICKGALAKLHLDVTGGLVTKHIISWYNEKNSFIGNGYTLYNAFDATEKVKALITDSCTNHSITKFVNINVRPPLQITYLSDTSICQGQSINLFTDGSGGDSSAYSFVWNNNLGNGQSKTVSPIKTTFYRVILKDNCTFKSDTTSCTIAVPPVVARVNAIPEITDIEHPQIVFKNNSTPSVLNNWDFGNGLLKSSNTGDDIEVLYTDTGFFYISLSITSPLGCVDDTTIRIRIKDIFKFYIPNAFTPDGNGLNDKFIISTRGVKKFKLTLYDRWGGILFETNNPEKGWDGKGYPMGVYVYTVELQDQDYVRHFRKGSFHLIR